MTGRVVSTANNTALQQTVIRLAVLVDMDFSSGHIYANDGLCEIVWNGHTFLPTGQFGGIDVVQEDVQGLARPLKLAVSGVDTSIIATAQNETYQNRSVHIYLALITDQGALVDTPEVVWEGRMDYMTITTALGKGSIALNCEHRLRREPRIARYTDIDQQNAFPGDTGFGFTAQIPGFISGWGNANVGYSGPTGAPPGNYQTRPYWKG